MLFAGRALCASHTGPDRGAVQKKLDDLKSEIMRLAEAFAKIPINTERLKFARQHFETGDYAAARAVLDAEQMGHELDALLGQKEQLQHQQAENEANLLNKANEFLILARLTAVDYTLPDRYDKTVEYFEQSLKSAHTNYNTFAYAYFLQQHNQFGAAVPFYKEALEIYHGLAEVDPQTYLPYVAMTLNPLGLLQNAQNEFTAAETTYQEALTIYRRFAEAYPQTYLPGVAMTLANLANLQSKKNDFAAAAEVGYQEAAAIYRRLPEADPQTYLHDLAMTLNNLSVSQHNRNDFAAAESGCREALAIRRRLAEGNPQANLPDVALSLNNLANLHVDQNDFVSAEAEYREALAIRRRLAEVNPRYPMWR